MIDFKICIKETKILQNIFNTISNIIAEVNFIIDRNGFLISAMDKSKVCIIDLFIKSTDFDIFELNRPKTFGVNIQDISKLIKNVKDEIIFEGIVENELIIKIKSNKKKERKLTYRILNLSDLKIMQRDLIAECYIKSSTILLAMNEFVDMVGDGEKYGDFIEFKITKECIEFSNTGSYGKFETKYYPESCIYFNHDHDADGNYSILYLNYFISYKSNQVELAIADGDTKTLRCRYSLFQNSKLELYVAPRVDDSDDFERDE